MYAEEKYNQKIHKLQTSCQITNEIFDQIRSFGSQPIISSMPINYCTKLAKWLDKLLKQFLPDEYTIKDTFEFVDKLHSSNFSTDKYFVSYDVEFFHTNSCRRNNHIF